MVDIQKKIIKDIAKKGWSRYRQCCDEDMPDAFFVFTVWVASGEANLILYYDWRKGICFFCTKETKNEVPLPKRAVDVYDVKKYVKGKFGEFLPLARKVARHIDSKNAYFTKSLKEIELINQNYDLFMGLVDWLVKDVKYDRWSLNNGLKLNGEKSYFIIGEDDFIARRLKRLGYGTVITYDEWGGGPITEFLDADLQYNVFDWEERKYDIDTFISEEINRELGDCIHSCNYDEQEYLWTYELHLDPVFEEMVKAFVKYWNGSMPFHMRCISEESEYGYNLLFKDGFKYKR